MEKEAKTKFQILILFTLISIAMAVLVSASYSWVGNDVNYTASEDTFYMHNLTNNVTGSGENRTFSIDAVGGLNILWNG